MSNYESDSGGGLPYWLPMIPDRKHQFVSLTAKYREKSQDTWQVFSAPVCTNLSPGIRVLELRADESK
jgi:predicted component of type VI protein secretion system